MPPTRHLRVPAYGRLILRGRQRRGLTQAKLGEAVGRSEHQISRYEHGEVPPEPVRRQLIQQGFISQVESDRIIPTRPSSDPHPASPVTAEPVAAGANHQTRADKERDNEIFAKTYLAHRATPVGVIYSPELTAYLGKRYDCELFRFAGRDYPATVLWKNTDHTISPNEILGHLDKSGPIEMTSSALLSTDEYYRARQLVKLEAESGPIKYEGSDYRMIRLDLATNPPRIHGAKGLYYDYLLTQSAIAWELNKSLVEAKSDPIKVLLDPGALPLRRAVEAQCNPFIDGGGRCAALSISTLLVFKRPDLPFHFFLKRRSPHVMVMPGFLHVAPAGMFEARHREEEWSVERNVWREMLEPIREVAIHVE